MRSLDILADLIAFPTVSAESNLALIDHCATILEDAGAQIRLIKNPAGTKANLLAHMGPEDRGGVMLSGHTDVVPTTGQDWQTAPFKMRVSAGKAYGRGTADMKGFIACVLAMVARTKGVGLQTPLAIALSYDEEIGCIGVRSLIDALGQQAVKPLFCIVGEPTQMRVATGHKGKTAFRVTCQGQEAHSALAPHGLNAIYMASDMIAAIRAEQAQILAQRANQDPDYDVPYSTLHVGTISGGTALNIVPNRCAFMAEIRHLASDKAAEILDRIREQAAAMVAQVQEQFPAARITVEVTNAYPALDTPPSAQVVRFVQSLVDDNRAMKVAFGTEGGLFSSQAGVPTVVCGPGSMDQGHKPDEFIALDQLARCDQMLERLVTRLQAGL